MFFLEPFVLQGKKLNLRTPEHKDISVLYDLIYGTENPEWKNYDAPYFPLTRISIEEYRKKMDEKINFADLPSQMIIEHNGEIIGTVGYYWEHEPSRWLEVGITIYSSEHWSGGFGTEALIMWIDYIFSQLEIARVGLTTWSGNGRMIRCAEKLGMQLEGRMRKCRYYNGVYYDSIRMGILREEWEQKHLK